jgi:hypothetical protein
MAHRQPRAIGADALLQCHYVIDFEFFSATFVDAVLPLNFRSGRQS